MPDGLLFGDGAAKSRANASPEEWRRYEFGLAVVESKRWRRPLDRRSGRRGEETAPSTQMLRYLRRVEDLTTGKLRWGMLTNGGQWRLYYQGARSVSEQFFEIDLPTVLAIPGHEGGLFALTEEARQHWLKVFALIFGREAFLPTPSDSRTFHQRALEEGRFYEGRFATNLSNLVFVQVFPQLIRAIAAAAPEAPLQEVREAALCLGREAPPKPSGQAGRGLFPSLRRHRPRRRAVHLFDLPDRRARGDDRLRLLPFARPLPCLYERSRSRRPRRRD